MKNRIAFVCLWVCIGEIIFFMCYMMTGSHGYASYLEVSRMVCMKKNTIDQLHAQIMHLNGKIMTAKDNAFYAEAYARECLHMARQDEDIYLI